MVLFRPYTSDEVQDAANTVMALWSGRWAIPRRCYSYHFEGMGGSCGSRMWPCAGRPAQYTALR